MKVQIKRSGSTTTSREVEPSRPDRAHNPGLPSIRELDAMAGHDAALLVASWAVSGKSRKIRELYSALKEYENNESETVQPGSEPQSDEFEHLRAAGELHSDPGQTD